MRVLLLMDLVVPAAAAADCRAPRAAATRPRTTTSVCGWAQKQLNESNGVMRMAKSFLDGAEDDNAICTHDTVRYLLLYPGTVNILA